MRQIRGGAEGSRRRSSGKKKCIGPSPQHRERNRHRLRGRNSYFQPCPTLSMFCFNKVLFFNFVSFSLSEVFSTFPLHQHFCVDLAFQQVKDSELRLQVGLYQLYTLTSVT